MKVVAVSKDGTKAGDSKEFVVCFTTPTPTTTVTFRPYIELYAIGSVVFNGHEIVGIMDGKTYRFAYVNNAMTGTQYVVMEKPVDVSTLYPPSEVQAMTGKEKVGKYYPDTMTIVFEKAPWKYYDWYVPPDAVVKVTKS